MSCQIANNRLKTQFNYKPIYSHLSTTYYMATHKTFTNGYVDDFITYHVVSCNKMTINQFVVKLCSNKVMSIMGPYNQ